jgi:hypothetical protein
MFKKQGLFLCGIMHVWVCDADICPMDAHILKDVSTQHEFNGDRTKEKQVLSLFI